MSSGPSVNSGKLALDTILASDVDMRLWTVAPNFAGTGGTQVTGGGYAPAVVSFAASVAGSGGQIAKAVQSTSFVLSNMPVASGSIVAMTLHEHSSGDIKWLDNAWTSPVSWTIGQSPLFNVGALTVAWVPVS